MSGIFSNSLIGDILRKQRLFTGICNGESLSHLITRQFQLSQCEAEAAIEVARREVAL